MLSFEEIDAVLREHYFDGMGCVSQGDARFLCDLIQESQPTKCFEVGVASGMSTTFLLKALAKTGPERELVSVDISSQYYACLLYTSPSPRDQRGSRMPSSA